MSWWLLVLNNILNLQAFPRHFVKRKVAHYVNDICTGLGSERVEWMIQNKKPLTTFVTGEMDAQLRSYAPHFKWAEQAISDQDFTEMLPGWCMEAVRRHGSDGEAWLRDTIHWIRGFFQ